MLRQQQAKNMRPRFACVKAAGALRERVGVLLVLLAFFVFWHIAQDVMAAGPLARLDGRAVRWFYLSCAESPALQGGDAER